MMPGQPLRIGSGKGLFLLICWWVLLTVAASALMGLIGTETTGTLRWAIVIQDFAAFILPVVLTMAIAAIKPADYLCLEKMPTGKVTGLVAITAIISIPAMNRLVDWNANLHLPESLGGLETILRDSESAAQAMVERIMGGATVPDLLISILIVGVLTGISEELFFRGALQRLLIAKLGNMHFGIWSSAFIFSAIHLQFFGFVPRLLMGAYFGYLVVWSGSLRLSMFAHALNNTLVVLSMWLIQRGVISAEINSIGAVDNAGSVTVCIASLALTTGAIALIRRSTR